MSDIPKHIRVKVTPSASEDAIEETDDGAFSITTRTSAEGGRANKRVCEMIARFYQIPEARIRVVKGHKKPQKVLEIDTSQKEADK